jgi:hypothetical protein
VDTLVLVDMEGLLTRQPAGEAYNGKTITLEPQTIAPGQGTVRLEVMVPEGFKVNDLAPFSMEWINPGGKINFDSTGANQVIVKPEFPLEFAAEFHEGEDELTGDLIIYYCEAESQSLCLIERVRITAPVEVLEGGADTLVISHVFEIPENFPGK